MRFRILMIVVIAMAFAPAAMAQDEGKTEARMMARGFVVETAVPSFHRATMVISGPDSFRAQKEIDENDPLGFSFADAVDSEGNRRAYPDGEYTWQVRMVVDVKVLENPRHVPGVGTVKTEEQSIVRSGRFSVRNGQVEFESAQDRGTSPARAEPLAGHEDIASRNDVTPEPSDNFASIAKDYIAGDLQVLSGICAGCANGTPVPDGEIVAEGLVDADFFYTQSALPFVWFDKTTSSWLVGQYSGDTFMIWDWDNGTQPFKIEEAAPTNALYVDSTGNIGLRTATPFATADLHILGPDSNAVIRLEESSSGSIGELFSGNGYLGFGHYDSVNGSSEPFRIWKGAPTNTIAANADGHVGFGVGSPTAGLHMYRNDGLARVIVHEGHATSALRTQFHMINNGPVNTQHETGVATWRQQFQDNAYTLTKNDTGGNEVTIIANTGDMYVRGRLYTAGPTCGAGCDAVLGPDFNVESIEEHAAAMWSAGFLPAIGPTVPEQPTNITEKVGGVLNELEKAHIYIEQLHLRLAEQEALREAQEERLARLEALLSQ